MHYKKMIISAISLFLSLSFTACNTNTSTRQITLVPSTRYQMESKPNLAIPGQFLEIPSPTGDQITCFLNQSNANEVFVLLGKEDWGKSYQFSSSESGFPKPVFCLNKQFLVMVDLTSCYQVDTVVNAKTDFFTYSEIAYDQEWVVWKETTGKGSQKPASATIMNWMTEEKQNIKIPSKIESMEYCAGYLLISARAKPDDVQKWWVFDTNTKKIASLQNYGDTFYSSSKSDLIYWSSEEKSQWTLFSLASRKVLKRIPYSDLPVGMIIPYTQNAQEAFWYTQKTDASEQFDEKAIRVELIHGMLDQNDKLQLTPLLLPDAYRLPAYMPEIEPCLWLQMADNSGKFYRLFYNATEQYILEEVLFPVQNSNLEPAYLSSTLTGPSNMTVLATNQAIYSFTVKEVTLIIE